MSAGIPYALPHTVAVTGIDRVQAVLGEIHLTGPVAGPLIAPRD